MAQNTEILLLGGAPGSGKSTIAQRLIELDLIPNARHLSIGDLKRSITNGDTPSAYAEMLQQKAHPDRKTGASPSEAMTGIMEEFILAKPDSLVLLDGFPRYMDRVEPFKQSVKKIGASVIGLCVVTIEDELAIERLEARQEREGQKLKDPQQRLADHYDNVIPVLELMSQDYRSFRLDGSRGLNDNASEIARIYESATQQN